MALQRIVTIHWCNTRMLKRHQETQVFISADGSWGIKRPTIHLLFGACQRFHRSKQHNLNICSIRRLLFCHSKSLILFSNFLYTHPDLCSGINQMLCCHYLQKCWNGVSHSCSPKQLFNVSECKFATARASQLLAVGVSSNESLSANFARKYVTCSVPFYNLHPHADFIPGLS